MGKAFTSFGEKSTLFSHFIHTQESLYLFDLDSTWEYLAGMKFPQYFALIGTRVALCKDMPHDVENITGSSGTPEEHSI